jgi:4-amino-4-deoxy-L-arabinose transferase-like glycosyltransferase
MPRSAVLAWVGHHPAWTVVAVVAVLQLPFLGLRELWWSDELRHAAVLTELREHGHWWALHLNGRFYPDKPPLYFLLLAGLQSALGSGAWVLFLGLALTVAAAGLATLRLGLAAGLDGLGALTGALLFLTSFYVLALGHYARMDFLFAALIAMSWASLWRALRAEAPDRGAILQGALWASLAFLVKGPIGIGLPALAFLVEAARRGRWGLIADRAVWTGAGIAAMTVVGWALGVHLQGGPGALREFWDSQIVGRATGEAVGGHGGASGLVRYLWMTPLLLLPWSLLWLVPGGRNRRPWSARGYLWTAIVTGLVPLSLVGEKHDYYLLPLLIPASILLAARLSDLEEAGRRAFARTAAGVLVLLGAVFIAAPSLLDWLDRAGDAAFARPALRGLGGAGILAILAGLVLGAVGRGAAAVGVAAASSAVVSAALLGIAGPASAILNPAKVAAEMRPWVEDSYAPGVVHGIGGVFQTALGGRYARLSDDDAARVWLTETERGVAAMEARGVERLPTAEWAVVGCAEFLGVPWVVLARPAPEGPEPDCGGAGNAG